MFREETEVFEREPESEPLPFTTWHLPLFRSNTFIERPSLQIQLSDKLKPSWTKNTEEASVVACCGLGGSGKTSLARDYIHHPYGNPSYSLKAWFSAEFLETDYIDFAIDLGIILPDEKIQPKEVIKQVKAWLEAHPGWLLVYDNAHFYDSLEPFLPTKGGNILITSRNPKWPSVIEVHSMEPSEAEAMVYRLSGNKEVDTPLLVKELGYLPLAIAQASAYMKENGKTAKQYLTLYQTEHQKLLLDGTLPPGEQHQHWPVAVTWQMNLQSAAALSPKSKETLECMAYVHAEGIPYSWLQRIIFEKPNAETEIELDKILKVLRSYSLIQHSSEQKTISLHRLVQTITRQKLNLEQQVKNLIKVIETLNEHYDFDNKKITENRQLIPHLLASLTQVETLSPAPVELIPVSAVLLDNLGLAYQHLGDYHQAQIFYKRALAIKETHYGPHHPQTGSTLTNLGTAYSDLGDYSIQKELLLRALQINETHYGKDHPETGITLDNLGNAYGSLGDYEKKKELLLRALQITETHYGKDHPETGATLTNLGNAYGSLGDYEKKKELLLRALTITETHYGSYHPQTGMTLDNLGNAYGALGDYERRKELLLRALKIHETHYGPYHPQTGIILTNLGTAYGALGDYEKQKELLLRALTITETHYGPYHPETGITLTNLGDAYASLKDIKTAIPFQKRAYDILLKSYGVEHQYTKWAFQQLQKLEVPSQQPLVFSNSAKPSNNNNKPTSSLFAPEQKPGSKKSECRIM